MIDMAVSMFASTSRAHMADRPKPSMAGSSSLQLLNYLSTQLWFSFHHQANSHIHVLFIRFLQNCWFSPSFHIPNLDF